MFKAPKMTNELNSNTHDVVIIGSGISGLSTAYHLSSLGVKQLALYAHGATISEDSTGIIFGGQFDNYTRVSHAHGPDLGQKLWHFGDQSYDYLTEFAKKKSLQHKPCSKIRLICSEHELTEARKATEQLTKAGFQSSLTMGHKYKNFKLQENVLAIQDDGPRSSSISINQLLECLKKQIPIKAQDKKLSSIREEKAKLKLSFTDGSHCYTEFVVLCCHLNIADFLPELKEALVSVAEQWIKIKATLPKLEHFNRLNFSLNHTYTWGHFSGSHLYLGGGRQFRPLAGIGATYSNVETKINKHLIEQIKKYFCLQTLEEKVLLAKSGLLNRPCDELPIIGPMFGQERILLATGYMGFGISPGFMAGKCLAELIYKGQSKQLPRELWPERFRSL